MMGMNFIEASKLNLYRKDGKMERIVFITKPTGTFTPMFLLDPPKMKLESFVWLAYMRPKSKEDIFQPRGKKAGEQLKKIIRREVPLPTLE